MPKTGDALFNNPSFFDDSWRRLPLRTKQFLENALLWEPSLTQEQLVEGFQNVLSFVPSRPLPVARIEISLQTERIMHDDRHLHEAVLPFSGSGSLWRAAPRPSSGLSLRGKIGQATIRLIDWRRAVEFDDFKNTAARAEAEAAELLPLLDDPVNSYNERLAREAEDYVGAFWEEIITWRARGQHRSDRDAKIDEVRQANPAPVDWLQMRDRMEKANKN
jgi:hypothetical protein